MIFIDDDVWPPSLHGTGTEDYFTHAWGMQNHGYLYGGSSLHAQDVPGYTVAYRFHVVDPIRFTSRIRVTIEHGHGNHLSDDWSSTAYWYQLPPSPEATILPVSRRLPNRPADEQVPATAHLPVGSEDEAGARRTAYENRLSRFQDRYNQRIASRIALTDEWELGNRLAAAQLRERYQ
jgi:hypothetical protein